MRANLSAVFCLSVCHHLRELLCLNVMAERPKYLMNLHDLTFVFLHPSCENWSGDLQPLLLLTEMSLLFYLSPMLVLNRKLINAHGMTSYVYEEEG